MAEELGSTFHAFRPCNRRTRAKAESADSGHDSRNHAIAPALMEAEGIRRHKPGSLQQIASERCARPRQPRLDHVVGNSKHLRGLGGAQTFPVTEHECLARSV